MDLISAIRSQQPVQTLAQQAPTDRVVSAAVAASMPPVAETMRQDAVQLPSAVAAQVTVQLAERDEDQHPAAEARAAALAAREAYIKASIAAGISPLPMP
ncbi:hypothetical protein [Rhodobacter sp. SY28-1]|uniref:hypothetical protein n=1 Tax=Rhodobacter sp. SY28-1 TaxID=2562317 RepID=UPI0010C014DC|nr:hypothetical protein [Rhodobacter sp. SY28-1]